MPHLHSKDISERFKNGVHYYHSEAMVSYPPNFFLWEIRSQKIQDIAIVLGILAINLLSN